MLFKIVAPLIPLMGKQHSIQRVSLFNFDPKLVKMDVPHDPAIANLIGLRDFFKIDYWVFHLEYLL